MRAQKELEIFYWKVEVIMLLHGSKKLVWLVSNIYIERKFVNDQLAEDLSKQNSGGVAWSFLSLYIKIQEESDQ